MIEALTASGAPWWLIVLLIVLMGGVPVAGSERAAGWPSILGAGARAWQGRKARKREEAQAEIESARAAAAEPTPSELLDDKVIERMDKRYDELAAQCAEDARRATERTNGLAQEVASLRREVSDLQSQVTTAKTQFWLLLGYTRRVMDVVRRLDPDHPLPPVPPDLQEWLGHG